MYYLELVQSLRLITDVCLEVAPGESVLCIADSEENMEVIALIAAECKARGAEVTVVLIEPRRDRHHEPPRLVAQAMKEADVVIAMVFGSMIHTRARIEACRAGVKYATLAGMDKEYLARLNLTKEDVMEICALTEKISQRLSDASRAHLKSREGSDLRMSLEGRKGVPVLPVGKKGTFCVPPSYAEAACAPVEDSAEGILVVDGTMKGPIDFEGLVEEPFQIYIEKGQVVKISGGKDARRLEHLLDGLEKEARTLAELGVNSNHKASKKLLGTHIDNAIAGHVHVALGRNDHIGGNSKTDTHLDLLVTYATLLLDGSPVIENGSLRI